MKPAHWLFWIIVICLTGYFLHAVSAILLPFVVGMGLAYMLDPVADRLEEAGFSRTLATVVISAVFFVAVTVGLVLLIPLLLEQLGNLVAELPTYASMIKERIDPYVERVTTRLDVADKASLEDVALSLGDNAQAIVKSVLTGMLKSGIALANFMSLLVITPVVSFYLLRDWDRIIAEIDTLLPRDHADVIRQQSRAIDDTLASFLRGTLNVMLILALFYAVTLTLAGLKYSLLIALIGGIAIIIPYIGTIISGALAVGVAYIQFDDWHQLGVISGIFIAGQILEGYVLTPKLVGESVGLNPAWVIFGMLAGGAMLGFVGILIAVPVTAICGVLLRFALSRYRESDYYHGDHGTDHDVNGSV